MFLAERPRWLGPTQEPVRLAMSGEPHSIGGEYTLVASTVFSRRPPPCASQLPTTSSVLPALLLLAVSTKLMPTSNALSRMVKLVGSSGSQEKFTEPRPSGPIWTPVLPNFRNLTVMRVPRIFVLRVGRARQAVKARTAGATP